MTERSGPMSSADRAYMEAQTGRSSTAKPTRTHEERVRVLLGWIVLFTGIVAVAVVTNMIIGFVAVMQATTSY